jgi:di/tricarboxylate transporter
MIQLSDSSQMHFVLALIAIAAALMASNRVRYDMIALIVVLGLMLSGVLTVSQALAGFGNSVVILIAGLLVIGEMLDRTGVARTVGDWILTKGGSSETRLLIMLMISASILGAIMSSTAVVAIFIPIVLRIANKTGRSGSQFLLPMSYAALVSGMLTLIATPPNLVISAELAASGFEPLGFFSFTPIGIVVLIITVLYMVLLGRRWLPNATPTEPHSGYTRTLTELWQDYRVNRETATLRISSNSTLDHCSIADSRLSVDYGIRILAIVRQNRNESEHIAAPAADFMLHSNDLIVVVGETDNIQRLLADKSLTRHLTSSRDEQRLTWELGAVSVLIHPNSRLIGRSLKDAQFRTQYGLDVFGVRRNQHAMTDFEDLTLNPSDSLLVTGPWTRIQRLQAQNHDFVVLETAKESNEIVPAYRRMPMALVILVAMVVVSLFDLMPLVAAVLIATIAAVSSRCLSAEDAYRSIHWNSLVLVAGMLPLADALQLTGGTDLIVQSLLNAVGDSGPHVMLTLLFFITASLTLILSNTASAVLMSPIAISAAQLLEVSPYPLAITVLFAASSAFMTPVASSVVTLVVEPGRYRFMDFLKLGTPLLLMVYLITYVSVPLLFPW